jgi:succinylarginine dihydrolase
MTTLTTPDQIEAARLLTLRQMLKLELKGMRRSAASTSRGRSAYAVLKDMGFKGTRESVLTQLDAWRDNLLGESK